MSACRGVISSSKVQPGNRPAQIAVHDERSALPGPPSGDGVLDCAVDQHRRAARRIPGRGAGGPAAEVGQLGVPGRHLPVFARRAEVDEHGGLQPLDGERRAAQARPKHAARRLDRGRGRAVALVRQVAFQRGGAGQGQQQIAVQVQGRAGDGLVAHQLDQRLGGAGIEPDEPGVNLHGPVGADAAPVRQLGRARLVQISGDPVAAVPADIDAVIQPHLGRRGRGHTDHARPAKGSAEL